MRSKYMSTVEATTIQQHSGLAVELTSGARPQFLNNVSSVRVFASGVRCSGEDWVGLEVYRDSSTHPEASSGFIFNQDIYSAVLGSSGYVVNGPFYEKKTHWASAIPEHLANAEIIERSNPNHNDPTHP